MAELTVDQLAERVAKAAWRECQSYFTRQVGEPMETDEYIMRLEEHHGDELEMVVTAYVGHTGFGGGSGHMVAIAGRLNSDHVVKLMHIVETFDGEVWVVPIIDSSVV